MNVRDSNNISLFILIKHKQRFFLWLFVGYLLSFGLDNVSCKQSTESFNLNYLNQNDKKVYM